MATDQRPHLSINAKLINKPMPSLFSRLSLAAAAIALTQQAASAATIYTSRAAFDAANSGFPTTVSDFEGLVGTSFPGNYDAYTGYQTTHPSGITVDGNQYVGTGPYGRETYLIHASTGGGHYNIAGNHTLVLGRQSGSIDVASNVFVYGFDYRLDRNQTAFPTNILATVTFADTTTVDYTLNVINGTSFWGIYSASAIDSISFNSAQPGGYTGDFTPYLLVDNVVSAVPEPSQTIASGLAAGFALTIVGRRNRKKSTAAL